MGIVLRELGEDYERRYPAAEGTHSTEYAFEVQRRKRESRCVYEDKVLRYGPYFAWVSFHNSLLFNVSRRVEH